MICISDSSRAARRFYNSPISYATPDFPIAREREREGNEGKRVRCTRKKALARKSRIVYRSISVKEQESRLFGELWFSLRHERGTIPHAITRISDHRGNSSAHRRKILLPGIYKTFPLPYIFLRMH